MTRSRSRALSPALALALALSACNGGLIAVVADDDETDSPPSVSALQIEGADASPATLRFRLVDADGDPARVSLFYRVAGGEERLLSELGGAENPASYAGSREGVEHVLTWDFAAEPDLPDDAGFTSDVTVSARVEGSSSVVPGANAVVLGLGNDAPVVEVEDAPEGEVAGIVPVALRFSDSSGDTIAARVEYSLVGEDAWQLVRPGGSDETPGFALVGLAAPSDGVAVNFFWDTDFDLPDLERDVRLRFTPVDARVEGETVVTEPFRVDNNGEATVILDNGLVATEAVDRRGGIAIPFSLRDPEGDDVRVVFQWRRPGEAFPALPADPEEVFRIQEDAALRAEYQVCSERTSWDAGRPVAVDATRVRLPELGTAGVATPTGSLVGRELELLRPAEMPVELTASWSADPLFHPVEARPLGDGREALVLDVPVPGTWRLQRVELATGASSGQLAAGSGAPTCLAVDPREQVFFVASNLGSSWRIVRHDLASGDFLGASQGPYTLSGAIRGMAARSEWEVVYTVEDELRTASFARSPAVHRVVTAGLATPWGVALDPLERGAALVALFGEGRVVSVDTAAGSVRDVSLPNPGLPPGAGPAFPGARGLAVDRWGTRLLVVAGEGGERRLRAMNLRSPHDLDGDGTADPFVYDLAELSPGTTPAIGVGPDRLRLLCDPGAETVVAIGGLEQRRRIVAAQPSDNVVELDAPLAPPLAGPRRWRVRRGVDVHATGPEARELLFAWDSRDVPAGGDVLFRALPFDSELGFASSTTLERTVVADVGARELVLDESAGGGTAVPVLVDHDRDGDLDVLVSAGGASRVVLQEAPGRFGEPEPLGLPLEHSLGVPLLALDLDRDGRTDLVHVRDDQVLEVYRGWEVPWVNAAPLLGPFDPEPAVVLTIPGPLQQAPDRRGSVTAADLEGDGHLDLLLALPNSETPDEALLVYRQVAPGVFDPEPIAVGGGGVTDAPVHALAADVDGDGLLDVVAAIDGADDGSGGMDTGGLRVFFQEAPGVFASEALTLGSPDPVAAGTLTTGNARAVAAADLDADGLLEVLAAHGGPQALVAGSPVPLHAGTVTVFRQSAPRVFEAAPVVLESLASDPTEAMSAVDVADLDADGRLDVVAQSKAAVLAFFGRGAGELDPRALELEHGTPAVLAPPVAALRPADLDGDGDLDLVFADPATGAVRVRLQEARGVPRLGSSPLELTQPGTVDGIVDVVPADLDGDGDMDFATANGGILGFFGSDDFKVFHQTIPRVFALTPDSLDGGGVTVTQAPLWVDAADLDQDGDRDLFGATLLRELVVFFQEEDGFSDPLVLAPFDAVPGGSPFANSIGTGDALDLDLDGDLDLLAHPTLFQALVGLEQTGPGAFAEAFRLVHSDAVPSLESPRDLAAGDLDLDGDLELLLAVEGLPGALLLFDGEGVGEFSDEAVVLAGRSSYVEVADVDGDGRPDVVRKEVLTDPSGLVCQSTRIVVHLASASGTFEALPIDVAVPCAGLAGASAPANLRLVDLDRDGDLDVLTESVGGEPGTFPPVEGLRVLEQVAPGVFAAGELATAHGGSSLFVEDVDGDGELDALLPEFSAPLVHVMRIYWGGE